LIEGGGVNARTYVKEEVERMMNKKMKTLIGVAALMASR
jgi:hypothetical protein